MRNRFPGKCNLCGCEVAVKAGRWRATIENGRGGISLTQNFTGLRCLPCSTTTKKGLKKLKERGLVC